MRPSSILMLLLVLATATAVHGRPYNMHSGKWMWDSSDVVCAVRMTKWTARESAPGQMVLVIEYSDLKSFKGADRLSKSGSLVMSVPDLMEGVRNGFSRECTDNHASLLFLKNESGVLQAPTDGEGQFCPVFDYDGPLSRFHSFKELLLYAAGTQPDNCYAFFELMTGFDDPALRDWLVAKSRSSDLRTAYFALSTLSRDKDPDAYELAEAALKRGKETMSPELRKSFEYLIENTEHFATQPPL